MIEPELPLGASGVPAPPPAVQAVFDGYPLSARDRLLALRALVFGTAEGLPKVGPLTETLKWGEPAYLTELSKSGATVRLAWSRKRPDVTGLFVNCRTSLVSTWREFYGDELTLVGNREIRLSLAEPLPLSPLAHCIAMALTYRLNR